jgi:hypothetical protein
VSAGETHPVSSLVGAALEITPSGLFPAAEAEAEPARKPNPRIAKMIIPVLLVFISSPFKG